MEGAVSTAGREDTAGREGSAGREGTAERLLRSTAARNYDPELDIDWNAPAEPGKSYMLERRCSLYGTPLWDRLSPSQRLELGKHEAASVAGTGIWLEFSLMRVLARLAYRGDPVNRHVQYALAELAGELPALDHVRAYDRVDGHAAVRAASPGAGTGQLASGPGPRPGHVGRDPHW